MSITSRMKTITPAQYKRPRAGGTEHTGTTPVLTVTEKVQHAYAWKEAVAYLRWQVLLGSLDSIVESLPDTSTSACGASGTSAASSLSQRGQGWCNPLLARKVPLQTWQPIMPLVT